MACRTISKGRKSQAGFTIVEFLIATTVFSLVLLVCSYAIIHVGKMYYKGVITNRTQDTARRIIDDVANAIQYSSDTDTGFYRTGTNFYCFGNNRYTVNPNAALGVDATHVLWKGARCSDVVDMSSDIPSEGGQEMVSKNMRITKFDIQEPTGSESVWTVSVRVSYGDDDSLFVDPGTYSECRGTNAGGQFCAVSELTTSVTRRLGGN